MIASVDDDVGSFAERNGSTGDRCADALNCHRVLGAEAIHRLRQQFERDCHEKSYFDLRRCRRKGHVYLNTESTLRKMTKVQRKAALNALIKNSGL